MIKRLAVRPAPALDEEKLLGIIADKQANGWEYGTHPRDKARIVFDAIKPYLGSPAPAMGNVRELFENSMEWQPIETAPIETAILLYCPELPEGDEYCFNDGICRPAAMNINIVVGVWRGREDAGNWVCDIVKSETGYYGDVNINPINIKPTHWIPLPKPPKSSVGGK